MRKKILVRKLTQLLADHPLLVQAAKSAARSLTEGSLPTTPPAEVAMADVVPALDLDVFRSLVEEIDLDGVREMLDVFLKETAERLTLMHQLSCQDDRVRIENEAHTLKGAAGTVGLRQVAELAKTLELSAHTITPEDYANLVDRLDACFRRARADTVAALATALERAEQLDPPV
jgi:HPt (histidine-containing phosphotransfer) domain-containing protein